MKKNVEQVKKCVQNKIHIKNNIDCKAGYSDFSNTKKKIKICNTNTDFINKNINKCYQYENNAQLENINNERYQRDLENKRINKRAYYAI